MTTRVHLFHGIRSTPASPVKGLIPYLTAQGWDVRYVEYGYELALETRFINPMLVGAVFPYIEAGDLAVGHSNGCALIYELMKRGAPFTGAAFINGALEQDIARVGQVGWIDCYWNPHDEITEAAKIGAELGIVDRDYGHLGGAGYLGGDDQISNINCGATQSMPAVSGHSDFFTPGKLAAWGPYLVDRIHAHLARALHSEAYA